MYSCCYPIWHTFDTTVTDQIEYFVLVNDVTVYSGWLVPYNSVDKTLRIDISDICRSYLDTFYEHIILNNSLSSVPVDGNVATIHTFVVRSDCNPSGSDEKYQVGYNYNTDYVSDLGHSGYLNDPIDNRVDIRQRIFACGFNLSGEQAYEARINGNVTGGGSITSSQIQMLPVDLSAQAAASGDTLVMEMTGVDSTTYRLVDSCPGRYALYYVNKYGGLDTLLCTGRDKESWNPTRTDVRLYNNRSDRLNWERQRIHQEIDHSFELNTGLLSDEGAAKIDHLVYTPKCFIHDLKKDILASCLITDSGYSVKRYRYDKVVQYTLTVKTSQQQIRK